MNLKHKVGFIALLTLIDVMVIVFVIMNNDKTNIKNDVSAKNSANIIAATVNQEVLPEYVEEKVTEELQTEEVTEVEETKEEENIEENIEEVKTDTEEEIKEEETGFGTPIIVDTPLVETTNPEEVEEIVIERNYVSYDDLTVEEREEALQNGTLALEYSGLYTNSSDRLTKSRGALYYNGHKETYYSEKVLPGSGLAIPGRHVADDGTIRDEDGYICVAADWSYMPKGSVLVTSLGPAKVYDTGCSYGTIDIYVSW